jgi:riboflavin synthase
MDERGSVGYEAPVFTGLVETIGTVRAATGDSPRRLLIASSIPVGETAIGDSVAIDGCCLTVVEKGDGALAFEAATETLARTTLGALRPGDRVNLERAMRLGDRLGGHMVLGHVDGVGKVTRVEKQGSAVYVDTEAPAEVAPLIAARGSVTIAGVSLTVTGVSGAVFTVGLIPHTLVATTFGTMKVGDPVNLEADIIARYLARLVESRSRETSQPPSLTVDFLRDKGFA